MAKEDLEEQLRKWRAARAEKQAPAAPAAERRTVRVNGQDVVIIRKPKRPRPAS